MVALASYPLPLVGQQLSDVREEILSIYNIRGLGIEYSNPAESSICVPREDFHNAKKGKDAVQHSADFQISIV